MKILIAEDQAPSAFLLRRTLEDGPRRHGGSRRRAGVASAARWTCRLLISDWMMPYLDGPALCRRIRSNPGDRYTYIILLTSRDRKEDRLEGLRAGADDFLDQAAGRRRTGGSPRDRRTDLEGPRELRGRMSGCRSWPQSTS